MTKHYELYQSRLVKQLAKMKRSAAHLTVSFRRWSEENDLLRKELLAAKSGMNKSGGMKTEDPAPEPQPLPQPAERRADKLNSRGWRLLTYIRRIRQRRRSS